MRRLIFPVVLGFAGCGVLVWLGMWQLDRLAWKEGILADIETRIAGTPVAIPQSPDAEIDRYLPVTAEARVTDVPLRVLMSTRNEGAGFRIIAPVESGGRALLADLGFVRDEIAAFDLPQSGFTITGNLHWPDEVDRWTPDPDGELWFARDVPAMAAALGTEPVLIVARQIDGADLIPRPLPVGTEGIRNDHLEYAITWFGLAIVWAIMSAGLILRTIRWKGEA